MWKIYSFKIEKELIMEQKIMATYENDLETNQKVKPNLKLF